MAGMTFEIQDAIVTSNKDPAKANRIKVALQDMDGQEFPEWLEPVLPPSFYGTPEPEQKVKVLIPAGEDLIEFAHMVRYIGVVWDEETPIPQDFQQNYPGRRGIQTKSGHTLIFDDDADRIIIAHGKTSAIIDLTKTGNIVIGAAITKKINLGSSAAGESVVLGDTFDLANDTMLTALAAYVALIAAVFEAFANDGSFFGLMGSTSQAAVTAAKATGINFPLWTGALAAFTASSTTWLSQKVKAELL